MTPQFMSTKLGKGVGDVKSDIVILNMEVMAFRALTWCSNILQRVFVFKRKRCQINLLNTPTHKLNATNIKTVRTKLLS